MLTITGTPLAVASDGAGRMGVWLDGVSQYYDQYEKGTFLYLAGRGQRYNSFGYDLGVYPRFTLVSHQKTDALTLDTVYEAGTNDLRIHQRISCREGDRHYHIQWTLTNRSSTTFTDCRLLHGGDTDFGNIHVSAGNWNPLLRMVYMTDSNMTQTGIMGLYGGTNQPADRYYEDGWWPNWTALLTGQLPNTVDPVPDDAGYSLQWNCPTLAPGQSWTVHAYERWTRPGKVQVIAPPDKYLIEGQAISNGFVVINTQTNADTFRLAADSSQGWDPAIHGNTNCLLAAGAYTGIWVSLQAPPGLSGGHTLDRLTLHAVSTTDPAVSNEDTMAAIVYNRFPPVAVDDSASVLRGGSVSNLDCCGDSLLDNDIDPEGHGLLADTNPVSLPQHGTILLRTNGTFCYTHDGSTNMLDALQYRVYDRSDPSLSDTGLVTLSVITVDPDNGPLAGGNRINISGGKLGSNDIYAVTLRDATSTIISQGLWAVTVRAGPHITPGTGNVDITSVSCGNKVLRRAYTYNPAGTITQVQPDNGPYAGGNTVTISGTFLGSGADITNVHLCGVEAAIQDQSPTQVTVIAGAAASAGTGAVRIASTAYGVTTADDAYWYHRQQQADLRLHVGAAPEPVRIGSNLVYALTVSNAGPDTATGITVTNHLSRAVSFDAVSSDHAVYTNQQVHWAFAELAASAATGLNIRVTVIPALRRAATNRAIVSGTRMDPEPTNNTALLVSTIDPTLDLYITGYPEQSSRPQALDYGLHAVNYSSIIINSVEAEGTTGGVHYVCQGWTGSGNVTAGQTNHIFFTLTQPSRLCWHWDLDYRLTLQATNGWIEGATEGWKHRGWLFDLYARGHTNYLFNHWILNGTDIGWSRLLTITADRPHTVCAVFESDPWNFDATGSIHCTEWRIEQNAFATFDLCNPEASGLQYIGPYYYAIVPNDYMHLRYPDGTNAAGWEYLDATETVRTQLLAVGNGDTVMDPGECATISNIEFLGKNPTWLEDYLLTRGIPCMAEKDTDRDRMPNAWENEQGLNMNNPMDAHEDPDRDRMPSVEEYLADTHPFDDTSWLGWRQSLLSNGMVSLQWIGGTAVTQYLDRSTSITQHWHTVFTNTPPTPRTNRMHLPLSGTDSVFRIRTAR
jgi:uncharacterized repeat protein (TIGR01451 family)